MWDAQSGQEVKKIEGHVSGSGDVRLSLAESVSRPRSAIEWCSHPLSRRLTARGCVLGTRTGLGSVQAALIAQLLGEEDPDDKGDVREVATLRTLASKPRCCIMS